MSGAAEPTSSTNVAVRVARILSAVAAAGPAGTRLLDVAAATGIARPTVHRILGDLTGTGFVVQLGDRRYAVGPALYAVGLSAPAPLAGLGAVRDAAAELADRCGDTVYVALRRPDGVQYLVREEGAYPVRAQLVEVGEVKPFCSSYGGLALLAALDDATARATIGDEFAARPDPAAWPGALDGPGAVAAKVAEVRRTGHCSGPGIVMPGVDGLAVVVPPMTGPPLLAVSISAVESRLTHERADEMLTLLGAAARRIAELTGPAAQ